MRRSLLIFLITLLYILPLFFYAVATHQTWRLDSDYDAAWSVMDYSILYFKEKQAFPVVHQFAGPGLPLRGDPTFPLFNPFVFIPFYFLGFEYGMWVIVFLAVFFSGCTMSMLLRSFKIDGLLSLFGAGLYMTGGALAARIAAGHTNYIFSYPLWPLVLYFLLQPRLRLRHLVYFSLSLALIFLSGDVYGIFFFSLFYAIAQGYYLVTHQANVPRILRQTLFIIGGTIVISSVKIWFMVADQPLLSHMVRLYAAHFGEGSIHAPFAILPFMIPWRVSFYDRPVFQRWVGFYFNWYEYYAFISPIPLLFLAFIRKVKEQALPLLIIILIVGVLYVSQKFVYSPFYWLFSWNSLSSLTRVPQRMYLPLTSIVITVCILCVVEIKERLSSLQSQRLLGFILVATLVWTMITNIHTISVGLEAVRTREEHLVQSLRSYDNSKYFVLNLLCCNQKMLVEQNIPIINFYSGWQSKETPQFFHPDNGTFNENLLNIIRPRYILAASDRNFTDFFYERIITEPVGTIWKTQQATISPP